MSDYKSIADFFLKTLVTAPEFNSADPCRRLELLYPEFFTKVNDAITDFYLQQPNHVIVFVETYRSNALQLQHYNNGYSWIKTNGMHHYGIAVDCAFKIGGKFTYEGNYPLLRECFTRAGLFLLDIKKDAGHVQRIPATFIKQNELRVTVDTAVRNFQEANGLKRGIVGPKTIAKAKEVYG